MIFILAGCLLLLAALAFFWIGHRAARLNHVKLTPRRGMPRIAVLIAARDESKVIRGLLESIQRQTVKINPKNVYVIVESTTDPTVMICREFGNSVILRQDLSKQRKGYALDEALRQILPKEHYDLFFIFDADNVLADDYFEKMLQSYHQGYDIATGYRNAKNGNANAITAVSSLTFTMINVMSNHNRARHGANIVFSGTGFFVVGDLVEEWRGWPFHSLTEDYELSLYATLHGLTTFYNETAMFYDEQPTKYKQTVAQRVRWIKGYFTARRKYIPLIRARKHGDNMGSLLKERIGVRPAIFAILSVICLIIGGIVELIAHGQAGKIWVMLLAVIFAIYIILAILTAIMLKREKTHFSNARKVQAVLLNPIYLASYIPCALQALLRKNVTWTKIKHGE